jgi:hypothetical protein
LTALVGMMEAAVLTTCLGVSGGVSVAATKAEESTPRAARLATEPRTLTRRKLVSRLKLLCL